MGAITATVIRLPGSKGKRPRRRVARGVVLVLIIASIGMRGGIGKQFSSNSTGPFKEGSTVAKKIAMKKAAENQHESNGGGTAVAEPPKRGRRPKQKNLNGIEPEEDPEIEEAAEAYEEARDARCAASVPEKEKKQLLIEVMTRKKRKFYKRGELEITIDHKEKDDVKVKRKSSSDDEDDEDGDDE